MRTVVTKFGGTSLAEASQFRKVKAIIEADSDRRYVIASAPGKRFGDDIKVTDMLLSCYSKAVEGADFDEILDKIKDRFQSIIDELGVGISLEDEIGQIRTQLVEHPSEQYLASRGEYLNSKILAKYLGFAFVDPATCVCFKQDGALNLEKTKETLRKALKVHKYAVLAGFYGADETGTIRTFSRGGSDISGSIAALAVHADLYENWTDVSGLLAADPRIVDDPKSLEYLSYRELRTLSYMGASVLHTDAVLPSAAEGIPINIRNTNRPEDPGTMIVRKLPKGEARYPVTGIAGRCGMTVIQVEKVMVSDGAGFSAILLDILKSRKIPFEQCLTGIDTITLIVQSCYIEECKDALIQEICDVLNPDFIGVKEHQSMIAVVGEKGTEATDANIRVLQALADQGMEISTINQGAGKLNLLIGVPEVRYQDAIKAIYSAVDKQW